MATNRDADYEVFLAAPMSALDPSEYGTRRDDALKLIDTLSKKYGVSPIYFAGTAITQASDFTGEPEALRSDLTALRRSRLFVLIYPRKMVTSALVEAGYALALRLPCLLFARDKTDLPYLLNQAEELGSSDLLPPLRILPLGDPTHTAHEVASFRGELDKRAGP